MTADQPFDAIFFDFDGVILESADLKTQAICEVFAHLPPEHVEAVRQYHLDHLGMSRFKKFAWVYENLLERELAADESERLGDEYSRIVYQRVLEAPCVPGVPDVLAELQPTHKLFVVSGTPTDELQQIARERDLTRYFEEIWGSPTLKPDIVRDLLTRHELSPDRSLFIGDGLSDYKAAQATGLAFLARETPDQTQSWTDLDVPRGPDLRDLPDRVRTWS